MAVDIAIVGLGPVGATLANLLGKRGLSVAVFEREASCYDLPRAVHFDAESMRVFQSIDIAADIQAHTHVSPGMKFVNAQGALLVDWPRPANIGSQGWYPSYRFHQPDLERTLGAALHRWPTVQVHHRCDVFSLEEKADCVTLRYEDLSCGQLHALDAKYVVGCDGARSIVRRFIGSEMEDLGLHQRWLVLDILLKRPWSVLGDHSVQFCDPSRPATYIRGVGNRRRWEIMLLPEDDVAEIVRPGKIWPLLEKWITPQDGDLERGVVYTFHSVIANDWRKGRMLLAGDSAHQTPPFLGQGMCAGIRDAANLAWKLDAVVNNQLSADLLDTYQAERRPHVAEYIALAVQMGHIIQARDPVAVIERDQQLTGRPRLMNTLSPRLGASILNDGAGTVSHQPVLEGNVLMDSATGSGFALVSGANAFASTDLQRICASMPVKTVHIQLDEASASNWLGAMGVKAALIRPDRYVLGYANSIQEIEQLVTKVGRLVKGSGTLTL